MGIKGWYQIIGWLLVIQYKTQILKASFPSYVWDVNFIVNALQSLTMGCGILESDL